MVNQDQVITFIHNVGMKFLVKKKTGFNDIKIENENEDNQEYLDSINKKL